MRFDALNDHGLAAERRCSTGASGWTDLRAVDCLRVQLWKTRRCPVAQGGSVAVQKENRALHLIGLSFDETHDTVQDVGQSDAHRDLFQKEPLRASERFA
jgi:hypothetical protein